MKNNTTVRVNAKTLSLAYDAIITNNNNAKAPMLPGPFRFQVLDGGLSLGKRNCGAVAMTFFPDQYAKSMQVETLSLPELAKRVIATTAPEKGKLPYVKLAVFSGEVNPDNLQAGCLRCDATVVEITGIEGDKDDAPLGFDAAADKLEAASLRALLYTSASHTEEKPRFRVICPTVDKLQPTERGKLMARLNGVLGGALSPESFTLSQSYYFGHVKDKPAPLVRIIDGDRCIDECDDLDAGAISKGWKKKTKTKTAFNDYYAGSVWAKYADKQTKIPIDVDKLLADMEIGNIHLTQLSVIAALLSRGMTAQEAGARVLARTMEVTEIPSAKTEATQVKKLHGMIYSWLAKHPELEITAYPEEAKEKEEPTRLLQSSAEFVDGYVPPDYLIVGWLQRRYVYSLTAPTGSGKTAIALRIAFHVAGGLPLAGRRVKKGRVLMFAGENPDDVRSRWIKLCEEMGHKPEDVDVFFMPFTLDLEKFRKQIDAETAEHGPFSLLIVDTSASYYQGDEENQNVQLGNHARMLRTFVDLPGGPTILVTCHPTKTPNMENLLPRGGGAFVAEVDGNLVCLKDSGSMVVEITWHGKFRGPDFKTFAFKLVPGQSDKLVDTEGNKVWTVTARPISDAEQEQIEEAGDRNQDQLLRAMLDEPGLSLVGLAEKLGWSTVSGEPNKPQVHRMLKDLTKQKMVEKKRNRYVLTAKGEKEAEQLPPNHYAVVTPISEKPAARAGKATKRKGRSKEEKPTAKVAFMITQKQKQQLADLGYSEEEVVEMKPERAHEILRATKGEDLK